MLGSVVGGVFDVVGFVGVGKTVRVTQPAYSLWDSR